MILAYKTDNRWQLIDNIKEISTEYFLATDKLKEYTENESNGDKGKSDTGKIFQVVIREQSAAGTNGDGGRWFSKVNNLKAERIVTHPMATVIIADKKDIIYTIVTNDDFYILNDEGKKIPHYGVLFNV